MSLIVHKFLLEEKFVTSILMPRRATVMDIKYQKGNLQLWAFFESSGTERDGTLKDYATERRYFSVVGTGHDLPDFNNSGLNVASVKHVKSLMLHGGAALLHVFEIERKTR